MKFFETSAKTTNNVKHAFISIAYDIKYKLDLAATGSRNEQTLRRGGRTNERRGLNNPKRYCEII
jgi:hypothetical protein